MNITQILQSTSTTAKQQQVDAQKNSDKQFSLQQYSISDKAKSEDSGGELQNGRENNAELNRALDREVNRAFLDSKSKENVIKYKESIAKFRNSIKVDFSEIVKYDYEVKNGYVPDDWKI